MGLGYDMKRWTFKSILIDIILGFLMGFLKFLSNPHYTFSLKEGFFLAPAIF
jgi:hypothetical protein